MDQWSRKFAHLSATAVFCFGASALLLVTKPSLPWLLFLSGSSGAIIANYQRLAKLSQQKQDVQRELSNAMVTIQLYISPLIGGVFALVLWSAFSSGLLAGDFFPHIEGTEQPYAGFHTVMAATHPKTLADAMKGVFWCFLAGYSERFVPNILDKLVEKGAQ